MKTTLENILEVFEHGNVYLASEDRMHFLHLVHNNHRCFIKTEGSPEREMKMSDDLIVNVMLHAELISKEEYLSMAFCK